MPNFYGSKISPDFAQAILDNSQMASELIFTRPQKAPPYLLLESRYIRGAVEGEGREIREDGDDRRISEELVDDIHDMFFDDCHVDPLKVQPMQICTHVTTNKTENGRKSKRGVRLILRYGYLAIRIISTDLITPQS
jgi:hypothetical protein